MPLGKWRRAARSAAAAAAMAAAGASAFPAPPAHGQPQGAVPAPPVAEAAPPAGQPDGALALPRIDVSGRRTPPQATIGDPPPPFAGGQVARGGRVGLLGNRSVFDTPFSQNNYMDQLIRDQQARTIPDVLANDPAVRFTLPRFGEQDGLFIRGFRLDPSDFLFDGLPGLVDVRRPAVEGIERLEVLRGPSTLLSGISPNGNIGGLVNIVPKRAGDAPLTRLTGRYASDATFGGVLDAGRRFGADGAFGVRLNAALDDGRTPIAGQSRRFGFATLGSDYRSEKFRASVDLTYQAQDIQRPNRVLLALPGFAIPAAPRAERSFQQRWETYDSEFAALATRFEYDVLPGTTVFAGFGVSRFRDEFFTGNPTLVNARGDIRTQIALQTFEFDQRTAEVGTRSRFATGPLRHEVSLVASGYWRDVASSPSGNAGAAILSNIYNPTLVPERSRRGLSGDTRRNFDSALSSLAIADTVSAFEDRVQLLLGLRLQRVDTRSFDIVSGAKTSDYDRTEPTPAVGLTVRPWKPLSLYASYIEGLAPGPTAPQGAVNFGEAFAPAVSKQIEAGAKLDLGRWGASLALFQITQPSGLVDPTTRRFSVDGEQRNRGVDLSVFGSPVEGVRVLGGVTFLDAELTRTAGGVNDGRTAIGAPRVQLNIGGDYDLPFLPGLTARARVIHTSSQFYDAANTQSTPAWTRLDLGANYYFEVNRTPLVARFAVENVTGNDYWQSTGRGFLALGAPRTYLFSLSADL